MYCTNYACPILQKLECSRQIFEKYSRIKFHENQSSEDRVVPCGQIYRKTNRWAEMKKVIAAFSNFANA
jgi:hypothetical protein